MPKGTTPVSPWKHIFRVRTMMYTALWSAIGLAMIFALFIRAEIDLTVEPVRNPQFITLSDGSIRNSYVLRLRNKHGEPRQFRISLTSDEILRVSLEGSQENVITVAPDSSTQQRVYVTARPQDPAASKATTDFRFWVEDVEDEARAHKDTVFNGKEGA